MTHWYQGYHLIHLKFVNINIQGRPRKAGPLCFRACNSRNIDKIILLTLNPSWILTQQKMIEVAVVQTVTPVRGKLQSEHHHQNTNAQVYRPDALHKN